VFLSVLRYLRFVLCTVIFVLSLTLFIAVCFGVYDNDTSRERNLKSN